MERQVIRTNVGHFSIEEETGSSMIERIQKLQEKHGCDVKLVPVGGYSGYDDYDIYTERLQTDEEYEASCKAEKLALDKKEAAKAKQKNSRKANKILDKVIKGQSISQEEKDFLQRLQISVK